MPVTCLDQELDAARARTPLMYQKEDCHLQRLLSRLCRQAAAAAAADRNQSEYFNGPRELYAVDTGEVRPGEVVLVLLLLAVWVTAIAVFLRKWRSIRILQPGETRFKHAPKNLETIKVVAKHRDSVIYKSYTETITKTMQARQKRLDRMNTMPNIKLGELLLPVSSLEEPRRCASIDIKTETGGGTREAKWAAATAAMIGGGGPAGGRVGVAPGGAQAEGEVGIKSLAQSCTSIAIGFHSNTISPVMEVEEESDVVLEAGDLKVKADAKKSIGVQLPR